MRLVANAASDLGRDAGRFWDLTGWSWIIGERTRCGSDAADTAPTRSNLRPKRSAAKRDYYFPIRLWPLALCSFIPSHIAVAGIIAWLVYDCIGLAVLRDRGSMSI